MLEENKKSFHTIYKGIHKEQHISKRRRKNENRRKSNEKKEKAGCKQRPTSVWHLCWKPAPPSLAIPEECVNVEDVAELLNRRDAPYIAQMLQSNHLSNAVGSRIITNLKADVRDVYCFPVP